MCKHIRFLGTKLLYVYSILKSRINIKMLMNILICINSCYFYFKFFNTISYDASCIEILVGNWRKLKGRRENNTKIFFFFYQNENLQ